MRTSSRSTAPRGILRRSGRSAVEAMLVLPVVITFLFGILEYGRYVMTMQVLTNAAREGARYALTHTQPVTVTNPVGGALTTYGNATTDVTNVVNKALGGQSLVGQTVDVYLSNSLGVSTGNWNNAQAGDLVCVRITGNYRVLLGTMLYLPTNIPVSVRAAMRSESN